MNKELYDFAEEALVQKWIGSCCNKFFNNFLSKVNFEKQKNKHIFAISYNAKWTLKKYNNFSNKILNNKFFQQDNNATVHKIKPVKRKKKQ